MARRQQADRLCVRREGLGSSCPMICIVATLASRTRDKTFTSIRRLLGAAQKAIGRIYSMDLCQQGRHKNKSE